MKLFNYHELYFVAGMVLVMTLFGDSLLLFLGHSLHGLCEFIASFLEHGLQAAFSTTERQAKMLVFINWLSYRITAGLAGFAYPLPKMLGMLHKLTNQN